MLLGLGLHGDRDHFYRPLVTQHLPASPTGVKTLSPEGAIKPTGT